MIVTADIANAVSKVNPIFLEGTLKIASSEAKSVGLRDGQIIQAVIENRGDHTKLLIGNKEFEIPKKFSHWRGFQISSQGVNTEQWHCGLDSSGSIDYR